MRVNMIIEPWFFNDPSPTPTIDVPDTLCTHCFRHPTGVTMGAEPDCRFCGGSGYNPRAVKKAVDEARRDMLESQQQRAAQQITFSDEYSEEMAPSEYDPAEDPGFRGASAREIRLF